MPFLFSCATHTLPEHVQSMLVESVDLERYAGLWYQVARYPHSFQRRACGESTAEYTFRDDGKIAVINRCWEDAYGGALNQQVRATGRPVNESGNWLRVYFFKLFPANYLIIELDSRDYQWAAVTTPNKKTLWILSRTPLLDEQIYQKIIESLVSKGFDERSIIRTSQQK